MEIRTALYTKKEKDMGFQEFNKIRKRRSLFLMFLIVVVTPILFLNFYGGIASQGNVSCIREGEVVEGIRGFQQNEKMAQSYEGKITDELLEKIHEDYINAPKGNYYGEEIRNTTYSYFESFFHIGDENYLSVAQAYPDYEGELYYGYSDNWQALLTSVEDFLKLFVLFIVIMVAPLFSWERECNMTELLQTAKNGGRRLVSCKVKMVYAIMNCILVVMLIFICVSHLVKMGWSGFNTSIQCGIMPYFSLSALKCSYGELLLYTVFLGIIACNSILTIVLLSSLKARKSLYAVMKSIFVMYVFSFSIWQNITNNGNINRLLSLFPINALDIYKLTNAVSFGLNGAMHFVLLVVYHLVFFLITFTILRKKIKRI